MSNGPLRASVVINTYNRATYLPNAIASIASQSYPEVELIIVNGPSTDHTEAVLDGVERSGIRLKRATCLNKNLSESRNIGISETSGDVVFFIDDDAVAHRDWVTRLMRCYNDPIVGGAGGFTFDHTGVSYQCRYTVCDKFGNARFFDTIDPQSLLNVTTDFFFASLLGTNCSFSRSALETIGGFDEIFEYMLDETDVCARMMEHDRKIVTVPNAFVFHKYAPSETRTLERIPKSLLAPARSKAYFCFKHSPRSSENALNLEAIAEVERYRKDIDFSNKWFLDHRKISPAHYSRISQELSDGISEGMRHGVGNSDNANRLKARATDPAERSFLRTASDESRLNAGSRCLKIYFVSQGYPPGDTAGIARWTHECATELSLKGNEVHVIVRSLTRANHVDFRDGVWIHSVVDEFAEDLMYTAPVSIPESTARRAEAVLREIKRAESIWGLDIVSAPIWDVEGILCCAHLGVPVVTSLHTTYKLAMPFKPEWRQDQRYRSNHVDKIIAAEAWLLENSYAILANSKEIIAEIDLGYNGALSRRGARVTTVLHGVGAPIGRKIIRQHAVLTGGHAQKVRVLFVGRIEERKGPDQLLSALAKLPGLLDEIEVELVGAAGQANDPYGIRVTQLAERLKSKHPRATLNFCGYVNELELERHYAEADILVAPSRFESFGLVLIEAMRHGIAVLACNVGGMREIITDSVDGYLVKVDSIDELAARLKMLITDRVTRAKLGQAAQATYESRFTARKMADEIETMLCAVTEEFSHG